MLPAATNCHLESANGSVKGSPTIIFQLLNLVKTLLAALLCGAAEANKV